ncbi:MAG: hypothetical protein AVDCRST_MAG08-1048 [uncultured Acetobacteraceae bacterium]|uniref:Uncharacterized protein n=1 Tax=uncultured Acetobacteraceae bacterium TaxID=169975 RepID=A0A6J4HQD7_9PROT|nr:MAG: hypothetical protein AVDCRST_MAG08-1048 [uncultured Acetobacteraceae bacterium]
MKGKWTEASALISSVHQDEFERVCVEAVDPGDAIMLHHRLVRARAGPAPGRAPAVAPQRRLRAAVHGRTGALLAPGRGLARGARHRVMPRHPDAGRPVVARPPGLPAPECARRAARRAAPAVAHLRTDPSPDRSRLARPGARHPEMRGAASRSRGAGPDAGGSALAAAAPSTGIKPGDWSVAARTAPMPGAPVRDEGE